MALTEALKEQFKARVSGHGREGAGVETESGMLKIPGGLVARSSRPEPEEDVQVKPAVLVATPTPVPVKKVPKRPIAKGAVPYVEDPPEAVEPAYVRVVVTLEGLGQVPSQYTHCHIGEGIAVLGLTEFSYIPPQATMGIDDITGKLSLSTAPGRIYVFGSNTFVDSDGIKNIVLAELVQEQEDE